MTENNRAQIKPAKTISAIWLIPFVAVIIGSWMVYYNWKNQGPVINIEFKTASGIEVGTTKIKSLDVDIGQVIQIRIKPDLDGVVVTARLSSPDYVALLREDTHFWVVAPQITRAGVSGLHTLLSGPYIELYPGEGQDEQFYFTGLESAPLTASGTPGLSVTLESEHDFSFSAGDPILYKGFSVGKIEDIYFNTDENTMYYNAFIEAPYHTLIRTNTRFWKTSGIELDLSADGVNVQADTLETIMRGGLTFGLPDDEVLGARVEGRTVFEIYPDEQTIVDERFKYFADYILLIEDSIRGLKVGAPVEFRGVKIGQVVRTDVAYQQKTNLLDKASLIPVMIRLEPGRMGLTDDPAGVSQVKNDIDKWIAQGLRATLKTGNLVTGSQLVELQYYDDLQVIDQIRFNQHDVIPVIANNFSQIGYEISELVGKLNNLPIESVGQNTETVLLETKQILAKLQRLPLESVVNNADQILIKTNQVIDKLEHSVVTLEHILVSADNEQLPQNMNKALRSVNDALLDLKPLLIHLKNKPNGLIFTGKTGENIEPKGAAQ